MLDRAALGTSCMMHLHGSLEFPSSMATHDGGGGSTSAAAVAVTPLSLIALSLKRCFTVSIYDNRPLTAY